MRYFLFIIVATFVSCSLDNPVSYELYENGAIKAKVKTLNDSIKFVEKFDSLGNLESKGQLLNNKFSGVWEHFHSNGIVYERGVYSKGNAHGWFSYYDSTGKLTHKKEFVFFQKNKSLLNQMIYYDEMGNSVQEKSNYVKLSLSHDTLMLGDTCKLLVQLESRYFKNDTSELIELEVGKFNEYFVLDGDIVDHAFAHKLSKSYSFTAQDTGKHFIRGILTEYSSEIIDSVDQTSPIRFICFSKAFYVKK